MRRSVALWEPMSCVITLRIFATVDCAFSSKRARKVLTHAFAPGFCDQRAWIVGGIFFQTESPSCGVGKPLEGVAVSLRPLSRVNTLFTVGREQEFRRRGGVLTNLAHERDEFWGACSFALRCVALRGRGSIDACGGASIGLC